MDAQKRSVHFAAESNLMSPGPSEISTEYGTSSSLQYINSQLVAHGFAPSPGISLDGVSNADSERVVKCMLNLLSQRVEDMSRTENLSTKLRTLGYDHERLQSIHRTTSDQLANAEREASRQNSRFTGLNRTLQNTDASHKQTMAELQRTRSTLQAVRATHQAETKKREKEIERIAERWSKISDAQTKICTTRSGLRCANLAAIEGTALAHQPPDHLEQALREAEATGGMLRTENNRWKGLVLSVANELQTTATDLQYFVNGAHDEQPTPFTMASLFPMQSQQEAAGIVTTLLSTIRQMVSNVPELPATSSPKRSGPPTPSPEVRRLQNIIATLRSQLEDAQHQAAAQALEAQDRFDRFVEEQQNARDLEERSFELRSAPLDDEERAKIDDLWAELDGEREKVTEVTVKINKDRAALEAERAELNEERRKWELEKMLAHVPPIPPNDQSSSASPQPLRKSQKRSHRKSPLQVSVGKAGKSPRKKGKASGLTSNSKVDPPYRTEYFPPSGSSFKLTPLGDTLLPSTFSLPPASPRLQDLSPSGSAPAATTDAPPPSLPTPALPTSSKLFPAAKHRAIHAYSPARPSPLSRILMLGNSPSDDGSNVNPLEALLEETSDDDLARALGITSEDIIDDDSPLKGKKPPSVKAAEAKRLGMGKVGEKENTRKMKSGVLAASSAAGKKAATAPFAAGTSSSRAKLAAVKSQMPKVTAGPRRIPVNSVDAPVHARR